MIAIPSALTHFKLIPALHQHETVQRVDLVRRLDKIANRLGQNPVSLPVRRR